MSEYQDHEFRAIDRPLTDRQMRELRAISSRAAISRTSFSNHYEWGDLKANPRDLLVKYFDASLYFAHWLYAEVSFRFLKDAVDLRTLRRYATDQSLAIKTTGSHIVVTMSVEREDFDGADDGASWLSSMVGLRGDIASGDERPLYFAWLLGVQLGQVDDEAAEPGRPDGLGHLSPSLASFIDIMGFDRDLIAAAVEGTSKAAVRTSQRDVDCWLAGLKSAEHVMLLSRVARGEVGVGAELIRRFHRHAARPIEPQTLRTVGALRARAQEFAQERRRGIVAREAKERAQRERERTAARERHLATLATRQADAWRHVNALIDTKRPGDYDAATALLEDLYEIGERKGRHAEVTERIRALREMHAKKPSFLARLRKAGL